MRCGLVTLLGSGIALGLPAETALKKRILVLNSPLLGKGGLGGVALLGEGMSVFSPEPCLCDSP